MDNNMTICIGRQMGSGGSTIAKALAERLGAQFYDREILSLAADESGFCTEFFEENDENRGFLKTLFHLHAPHVGDSNFYNNRFSQEWLFQLQSEAIRKAAEKGSCVFVGRCADYILRDFPGMVSVFVTADAKERLQRVALRRGCDEDSAAKYIDDTETRRAAYYNYYTGKIWAAAEGYDLCVNSSRLGIEGTVELLAHYVEERRKACPGDGGDVPESQLP